MSIHIGSWVKYTGQPAIVVELSPLQVHLIDENGETVLQESNDTDPQNGNPRSHVAKLISVNLAELASLSDDEIPVSRR